MVYAVIAFDVATGKAIIPGIGGGTWEAKGPIPVPAIGETLCALGNYWRVVRRAFRYDYVLDAQGGLTNELAFAVSLGCTRIADGEESAWDWGENN